MNIRPIRRSLGGLEILLQSTFVCILQNQAISTTMLKAAIKLYHAPRRPLHIPQMYECVQLLSITSFRIVCIVGFQNIYVGEFVISLMSLLVN